MDKIAILKDIRNKQNEIYKLYAEIGQSLWAIRLEDKETLTTQEVKHLTGLSQTTLNKLVKGGTFPCTKVYKTKTYRREDVMNYLNNKNKEEQA
jgi:predicted DNA-binding transcriptional regulator AlpA